MADIVTQVAGSFRPRTEAAGVDLVVAVPNYLPAMDLDRLRIEQVLANLRDNAVGHTSLAGTIALAAENAGDSLGYLLLIPVRALRPIHSAGCSTGCTVSIRPANATPAVPAWASPSRGNRWKPTAGPFGRRVKREQAAGSGSICRSTSINNF